MQSRTRIKLVRAVVIALLYLATVELAGVMFFSWRNGSLVYLARPSLASEAPSESRSDSPPGYKHRLHPYFGFVGPYDMDLGKIHTNSLGFLQRERMSIPYQPLETDYVIVVFGGSVAARVVAPFEGGTPLVDVLKSSPVLAGRRPVVINMAQGSGKQPQQLIELAYLLALGQHIDLALNIDGFNEFALGWQNIVGGLDPILPALQKLSALATEMQPTQAGEEYYHLASQILTWRKTVAAHNQAAAQARTGISYAWHTALAAWRQTELARATTDYESLTKSDKWSEAKPRLGLDLPRPEKDSKSADRLFDLWLRSSQQMRALANANKFRFVHVVQPNQYFSQHAFSESEGRIALSTGENHDYRVGTRIGYSLVAARSEVLTTNRIVSALSIFDSVEDEVFSDGCCHYNKRGETLFAEAVAEAALEEIASSEHD